MCVIRYISFGLLGVSEDFFSLSESKFLSRVQLLALTIILHFRSVFLFFFFSQILKHAILQMDQKVKHTSGRLAQHTFCFLNMSSVTPTLNIGLWSYRACIHCVYLCSPRQTHV